MQEKMVGKAIQVHMLIYYVNICMKLDPQRVDSLFPALNFLDFIEE